jgi:murein DD-endopeptidase MepM/ murein hydrolase activator NlpD
MDIIIVSNRLSKAQNITLGGRHLLMAVLLIGGLCFAAGFAMHNRNAAGAPPGALAEGVQQQSYMREGMNAMAVRLGQMQAQLLRLDTLGARLAKLNGMKPQEFNFDQPPAQGGPYVPAAMPQNISFENLSRQLDTLATVLNDRNDKLVALETMQLQDSLNKKLLPSRPPIFEGLYSSNFGWRIDPFTGQNAMHEGVDFMVPEGTPIHASAGGIVVYADIHPQYGKMVEVDHGNDIVTRYAHASKLMVKVGQVVRRGQEIAKVGSTGRSTGSHLHFEVRYKGVAQNPKRFLQSAAG